MEAKLCNLLFFSQRPRKASGVVQRLECQRVHSVECSPVWRPENQDCRGSRGQTSYTQRAGGRCQTSYTQGPTVGARPRTRRGLMVDARPHTHRGQQSGPDLVHTGANSRGQTSYTQGPNGWCQTSYMQAERVFNLPPLLVLLRPHRLG